VIRVVVGELAHEAVDAVLRPADATLAPVGDAAARLDQLGGGGFAAQRRAATPLEAGAAVVTGGGALTAGFVLHVVVADERGAAGPEQIRRALVSAWQRAGDWGLLRVAAPSLVGGNGQLTVEASATLLVETFPGPEGRPAAPELRIVVDSAAQREIVEGIVRRTA
jgi:O-acetyl-ADP-ribose deacetylase (regulator of RNase III)